MPRHYTKKTPGRTLISEELIIAAKKLIDKGKSKRFAADSVGINEATLRKRLKLDHVPIALGRFKPTFTKDQEAEFAVHCEAMDNRFFGVTINDLRRLAYEFAEANKIQHRFDKSSRMAGRDWVESFLKRNEHLGLRQSAPVSLARAIGFNKVQVEKFYKNLKEVYEKYKFQPHRIYNMDETGMSTVPKKTPKVVARKGKKVVGKIVSAERGMTITAVMCMSATGHFVPPAMIYPRKKPKAELLDDGPTGSVCMVSDSGFINANLFVNWLSHFKDFVHPTEEDPVLLIMDNHSSHISLDALNYAKEHHIVMLTIPPHGSHKIQPLDVAVHSPLKTKYSMECEKWMNRHPGRGITQYQVAGLFNNAYKYVATMTNAESGFRATGIYPYADDLFDETDFAPSLVTDQRPSNLNATLIDDESNIPANSSNLVSSYNESQIVQYSMQNAENLAPENEKRYECASDEYRELESPSLIEPLSANHEKMDTDSDATTIEDDVDMRKMIQEGNKTVPVSPRGCLPEKENTKIVTVAELSPLPCMTEKKKRSKMSMKSEIITSSPYKKQLEEKRKIEEEKILKKRKKVNFDEVSRTQKIKQQHKSFASEPQPGPSGVQKKKKQLNRVLTETQPKLSGATANKENKMKIKKGQKTDHFCPICDEKYEDPPTEDWIECSACKRWFHEDCTAYEMGIFFRCDFCDE